MNHLTAHNIQTSNGPAFANPNSSTNYDALFTSPKSQRVRHGYPQNAITLQLQEGTISLPYQDIVCLQGERNYTYVITKNRKRILVAKTLKEFEAQLNPQTFFRCHKSFLVNGVHIQNQKDENVIELSGKIQVMISRRKKSDFKRWFSILQDKVRAFDYSYAAYGMQ
ncbi:MAG: LytR/AlgR family response regulator transcription factor [Bacteroidia bacterium]